MEICYYTDVTRVLLRVFGAHFPRPVPVGCGGAGRPPARGLPSIAPRRVPAAAGVPPETPQGVRIMVSYMIPLSATLRDTVQSDWQAEAIKVKQPRQRRL